jgi:hypothetical protein
MKPGMLCGVGGEGLRKEGGIVWMEVSTPRIEEPRDSTAGRTGSRS